ncbi:abscission/NoCut checkpoint regulator isoform X2 [Tachypleus tridentatus]|uniref:abscission/NoCut checkpoint regulator isoform X2 n=2 Tax=Tachypleus tridentatus TaxID=6853 RepID=UPI003FD3DA15
MSLLRKMSCHGCGTTFGIFRKEYGCKNCGFAFCGKCCCKKTIVPNVNQQHKQNVCNMCFDILTKGDSEQTNIRYSPPLALKRRMEALQNRHSVGSTCSRNDVTGPQSLRRLSSKDVAIAERLQKLKEEKAKGPTISQTELQDRLAKLKGMDPKKYSAPPITVFREAEHHTESEMVDDLLKEVQEEVEIDSRRPKPEDEIAARLARLRGEDEPQPSGSVASDLILVERQVNSKHQQEEENVDLDELNKQLKTESEQLDAIAKKELADLGQNKAVQEALSELKKKKQLEGEKSPFETTEEEENKCNAVVEQILDEAALEEKFKQLQPLDDQNKTTKSSGSNIAISESGEMEELPWCVICNEDALVRCLDCEGDLYCMRCFKECHDSFDIKDHRSAPYKPTKTALKY